MADDEVTISERRIDWITCSARLGSRADALEDYGIALLEDASSRGDTVESGSFQIYSGQRSRHIFVGTRYDGALVRVGGVDASDAAAELLKRADHVSRLDYCVTVFHPDTRANYADDIWQVGVAEDPDDARLPTLTRTQQRWGGYTTYLGRRASAVMGRVYDKFMESKGEYARGSWRFELELKQHASEQEHARLVADPSREDQTAGIIGEQFRRWGLLVPWDTRTDTQLWRAPARNSDLDNSARWLGHQYRKTAYRYVARYGIGAFLGLFGLDDDSMKKEES